MMQSPFSSVAENRKTPAYTGNPFAQFPMRAPETSMDAKDTGIDPFPRVTYPAIATFAAQPSPPVPSLPTGATKPVPAPKAQLGVDFFGMLPEDLVMHSDPELARLAQEQPTSVATQSKEEIVVAALERRIAGLTPDRQAVLRAAGPLIARAANRGYAPLLDTLIEHVTQQRPLALTHPALAQLTVSDATILRVLCKEAGGLRADTPPPQTTPAVASPHADAEVSNPIAQGMTQISTDKARAAADEAQRRGNQLLLTLRKSSPQSRNDRQAVTAAAVHFMQYACVAPFDVVSQAAEELGKFSDQTGVWSADSQSKVKIAFIRDYLQALAYAWAPDAQVKNKWAAMLINQRPQYKPRACSVNNGAVVFGAGKWPAVHERVRYLLMCKSGFYSREDLAASAKAAKIIAPPSSTASFDLFVSTARVRDSNCLQLFAALWTSPY